MWSKRQFAFFFLAHCLGSTALSSIAYAGSRSLHIVLSTTTGFMQTLFIHMAFCSHYGSLFDDNLKNTMFILFTAGLTAANFAAWVIGDFNGLDVDCGYIVYYEKLHKERAVNLPSLLGNILLLIYSLTLYFVWLKKTKEIAAGHFYRISSACKMPPGHNQNHSNNSLQKPTTRRNYNTEKDADPAGLTFPQYYNIYNSKSMNSCFVGGIIFTFVGSAAVDIGFLPRQAIAQFFSIVFFAICVTCFVIDGSFMRMPRGLRRVRNNCAYLYTISTTLLPALNAMTLVRDSVYEVHGAVASAISLRIFSVLVTVLFKSMAIKASTGR